MLALGLLLPENEVDWSDQDGQDSRLQEQGVPGRCHTPMPHQPLGTTDTQQALADLPLEPQKGLPHLHV